MVIGYDSVSTTQVLAYPHLLSASLQIKKNYMFPLLSFFQTRHFRLNSTSWQISPTRVTTLLITLTLFFLIPLTSAQAQVEIYIVQPGDTLSEIAKDHGTDTETLRRLNGLGDIDYVWVGQQLYLPEESTEDEGDTATEVDDEPTQVTTTPTTATAEQRSSETPAPSPTWTATPVATPTVAPEPTATATPTPGVPGATEGVTAPPISQQERTGIHIVNNGETLSTIAVRYQTTLAHLIEFNQISPAQRLNVGQAIVVPITGEAVAQINSERLYHVVQAGEYLSTIAKQYDISVATLARTNGIYANGIIVPGQELLIPNEIDLIDSDSFQMGTDGYHVHTEFPTLTEKWIDVDLSEQRLIAYRGRKPIKSFLISSGLPGTPTVTGVFRIWAKTPLQDMYAGNRAAGYSYYIKDVPWVQYFYKDYGLHAAYWHSNFGHPMSHGCVNISVEDAEWLFKWASPTMTAQAGWFISDDENPGTLVVVHD